jgi:pimeloyl-ACP methyl ester carboxylesterase
VGERRTVVDAAGASLAVYDEGVGPPVLWIQGTGVAAVGWMPQVETLRSSFRCVSFDNRGIGASTRGPGPLTIDRLADDALAVLDALGLPTAHVVGHSLGGLIALRLARRARARVSSLGLLCTFASGNVPTRLSPTVAWLGLRTVVGTRAMRRRAFLELIRAPQELAGVDRDTESVRLGALFGRDLSDTPPIVREQVWSMRGEDETPHLAGLSGLPTLVMSGAEDLLAPPSAGRALAAGIGGAVYVELPGTAHGLPLTRRVETNERLSSFLTAATSEERSRSSVG